MSKLNFLIALFIMLCISGAYAQTEQCFLSVEKMFQLADANNRHIKINSTAVAEAKTGVKVAKNAYLPSINLELSLSYNGDGIITDRDFSNSFIAPIPHFGNNFAFEVSQVIYSGGAVTNTIKMSELKSQIAAFNAESNRQKVRFLIVGNYLELCKLDNQLQVFESHISQTQKILDNMHQRYREGVVLKNDITRYELQLQNLNYSKIELQNTKQILNNQLTSALGLSESVIIIPDITDIKIVTDKESAYWHNMALTLSPAVQIAETTVKINEYDEKLSLSQRLPQIFLFAADYLDGPITIDIPASDKNFNCWAAGAGIKYNLGNLYKSNKKIEERRIALQKANEEKFALQEDIRLAVQDAYIRYQEAFLLLETKEKSVELAGRNYDIVSYRYENDLVLLTDLLDASSQKLDAELQAVNASINIAYNYYKLKYISGTL